MVFWLCLVGLVVFLDCVVLMFCRCWLLCSDYLDVCCFVGFVFLWVFWVVVWCLVCLVVCLLYDCLLPVGCLLGLFIWFACWVF